MSKYEDMIKNVHRRIDEYEAEKRVKRAKIIKVAVSITPVCTIAILGIGLWKGGALNFHNNDLISSSIESTTTDVILSTDYVAAAHKQSDNKENNRDGSSDYTTNHQTTIADATISHVTECSESITSSSRTNDNSVETDTPETDHKSTSTWETSAISNDDSHRATESDSVQTDASVQQTTAPAQHTTLATQQTTAPAQHTTLATQQTTIDNSQGNSQTEPPPQQTDSIQYEMFSRDYPYYNNISDLANKANQVFSGKITNVSFEMLNMMTMQPLKNGDDTRWAMLCTIYEIEAEEVYAGTPTTVKLRIEGGISSGFEQEQTALLGSNRIPVMEGAPVLSIGAKYVFALYRADGSEYSSILNPLQSIYTEDAAKTGGFSAAEIITYFS
jgi:hypothetical protein